MHRKKKRIESHWDHPVICPGCGKEIKPDDDMGNVEYVRTKRKTDIFFHTECMEKVWKSSVEGGGVMADNGEFVQSIRDATAKIALDMEKKVSQACLVVEGEARQLCPVDQGHLRASITSETEITADEIIGRIGSNLEYAPYVHNGTGIYAVNGDGRKTPWVYEVKAGKYKVMHFTTVGQRPKPFLSFAIIYNAAQIEKILGG